MSSSGSVLQKTSFLSCPASSCSDKMFNSGGGEMVDETRAGSGETAGLGGFGPSSQWNDAAVSIDLGLWSTWKLWFGLCMASGV